MKQEIAIWSYFSIPTDLASEMRNWKEFISGEGYSVDLKDSVTSETVSVRLIEEWEDCYLLINSPIQSELFDRVVGKAVCALSKHSDYLQVRVGRTQTTK